MLEILNVSKSFNKSNILKECTFSILNGEIVGIVGNNGAGKTTILNIILGFLKNDSGSILLHGKPLIFSGRRGDIGFLVEKPKLFEHLTGYKNLEYFAISLDLGSSEIGRVIKEFLLEKYINKKVKSYSLGMKQMLALAISFLGSPSLVILDEPMNSLDPSNTLVVKRKILDYKNDNKSVLMTSHILSDIEQLCDRIYVLKGGTVKEVDKIIKRQGYIMLEVENTEKARNVLRDYDINILKEDQKNKSIHLHGNKKDIPKIIDLLVHRDIRIFSIFYHNKDLSQLFIEGGDLQL